MASPKARAFRSRVIYRVITVLSAIVRRLPLPAVQRIGRALGAFASLVVRRERRKALANIAIAFPEWSAAQRRRTISAMFRHLGVSLMEILWLPNVDLAMRDRLTTFEGAEELVAVLREGRGVVIITAHSGNWEWLAMGTGLFGFPTSVMQRERNEADVNDFITATRARSGVHTIDRGSTGAARELIQSIRRGGVLAFLIDQNIRAESAKVPFFGKPALTPLGPVKLAIRTEALLCFAATERKPDGTHHIRYTTPVQLRRDDDAIRVTAELTAMIEAQIRRVPEQWVWMHDRWRERPKWDVGA